jgi:hypothetical protein
MMQSALSSAEARAASSAAQHASNKVNSVHTKVQALEDQVERLALLNQALWELLRGKLGFTDADLERIAQEVDLRDGVADGKITARAVKCPACQRVNNSRRGQCMYCGQRFESPLFGGQ